MSAEIPTFSLDPHLVDLKGQKLDTIRMMTPAEMSAEGWDPPREGQARPIVLYFTNGTTLFASRDDEGNGPGTLFGVTRRGSRFYGIAFQETVP